MATSRAISDSPAEFLAKHFDLQAARNDANLDALTALKRSTPTALALTLNMRSELLHSRFGLHCLQHASSVRTSEYGRATAHQKMPRPSPSTC